MSYSAEEQEISLIIITRRDIFQWVDKMKGFQERYHERSAVVWLSKEDMKTLKIEDGDRIKMKNNAGAIVVQAKLDSSCLQGFAFMLVSHYSSKLVEYDPRKAKLPGFKRIEVLAQPTEEYITPISEF